MSSQYEAVFIGASAGCVEALSQILPALPADFPLPIMIVVHLPPHKDSVMAELLANKSKIRVMEASDKEPVRAGHAYFAPADYHMLVEYNELLSLSNDEEVLFSRPSIDVLFDSAADAYTDAAIGIILTGANNDGAAGLAKIAERGGLCIVQNPDTAYARNMPEAAIALNQKVRILNIDEIIQTLLEIGENVRRKQAEKSEQPVKVLVVDDDKISAQTIGWMLESIGYHAFLAHTGREALEMAQSEKPKAILLDITLPDMNGFEVCRLLKADPFLRDIYVAAQTGWSDEKDRKKALTEGFDEFLVKPVSIDDYKTILTEATKS